MDGVQRNFSIMAEKIDRMRCLRERCDNYVRLIKLTLDESIREQNSLLDGSAIHNRLKYLGLADCNPTPSLGSKKHLKVDGLQLQYPATNNLQDFDNKYKYLVFDDFDDRSRFGQHKTKSNLSLNDILLPSDYSSNSNYKPAAYVRQFPSTVYDDSDRYCDSNKYFGETASFSAPQEYRVCCFPTSKPIAQYPRHVAGRFYRRKPVKQYPQEQVPFWHSRAVHTKPVRVVEREPFYVLNDYNNYSRSTNDYRVDSTYRNIDPYVPEYRSKCSLYPKDYHCSHYDYNSNYHYRDADLVQRPFSSITRPCSPVHHHDAAADTMQCDYRTHLDDSDSLLEKKIRDYVWSPHKTSPHHEKNYYAYRSDYKPIPNKYQVDESFKKSSPHWSDHQLQTQSRQNETLRENAMLKRNSIVNSPGKKTSIDQSPAAELQKNDRLQTEYASYRKKSETPAAHLTKRISFDLSNEDTEQPDRKNSVACKSVVDQSSVVKEDKSRKESIAKLDNSVRRTSVLSNNDCSVNKQRFLPSNSHGGSRKTSLSKPERLASMGNSFESDKYSNLKNSFDGNDLSEKSERSYDTEGEQVYDGRSNDTRHVLKILDGKNQDTSKDLSVSEITNCNLRRDSTAVNSRRKLSESSEKSNFDYVNKPENASDRSDNVMKLTESYGDEAETKNENISNSRKNSFKNYENNVNSPTKTRTDDYDDVVGPIKTYSTDRHEFANDDRGGVGENIQLMTGFAKTDEQNGVEFDAVPNDPRESSQSVVLNDEYDANGYYRSRSDDEATHEYEQKGVVDTENNYYSNKSGLAEPVERPGEFIDDEGGMSQNPAVDASGLRENDVEGPRAEDYNDYYNHQDYSNVDVVKEPLSADNRHEIVAEPNDYYYQDDALAENVVVVPGHDDGYVPDDYYYQQNDSYADAESKNRYAQEQLPDDNRYGAEENRYADTADYYYHQDGAGTTEDAAVSGDPSGYVDDSAGYQGDYARAAEDVVVSADPSEYMGDPAGYQGDYARAAEDVVVSGDPTGYVGDPSGYQGDYTHDDDYYRATSSDAVDDGGYYREPIDEGRGKTVQSEEQQRLQHYDGYDADGYPVDSRVPADHYDQPFEGSNYEYDEQPRNTQDGDVADDGQSASRNAND